jgi:hypothetical protein
MSSCLHCKKDLPRKRLKATTQGLFCGPCLLSYVTQAEEGLLAGLFPPREDPFAVPETKLYPCEKKGCTRQTSKTFRYCVEHSVRGGVLFKEGDRR